MSTHVDTRDQKTFKAGQAKETKSFEVPHATRKFGLASVVAQQLLDRMQPNLRLPRNVLYLKSNESRARPDSGKEQVSPNLPMT